MATWKLMSEEVARESWDEALLRLDDYTMFQSYAWGEYRRALGWQPCHWAAFDDQGQIVAMMLGLLRRYPLSVGMVWSEGGPVGDLSVCDEALQKAIKETTGLERIYCRFRCDRARQIEDVLQLDALGWTRSWFNLTSNYSLALDLNGEESSLIDNCERNWRRNLRRAGENNLTIRPWSEPNIDQIMTVYASMQALKGISEQQSRDEIQFLLRHLDDHLLLYRCDDEEGSPVSISGWIVFGNRAWMYLSATTEKGRTLHASYGLFWALLQKCRQLGMQHCDLSGIDPVRNRGVYRFKRGTGAVPLEYLGEWDWATTSWLRWLGNWAISRRERLRKAESSLKRKTRGENFPNPVLGATEACTDTL
jgi:lipid II:glycine glycyltransferase (peptidoglycan interpeptide bridge formation enzyme)